MMIEAPDELRDLRNKFTRYGLDLRFVGGCVRDSILGITPKDIDLCTNADPNQQKLIYDTFGFLHHDTGVAHGTYTVSIGDVLYEITSLRLDVQCDGRHAEVEFTDDWEADLARRDLTINAMAQTFDGKLIDPFCGLEDLRAKRVRFVGRPEDRMQEDYLRILRWLRFHGRFGGEFPLDFSTMMAAMDLAQGLKTISRERIWMEVAKIITGPRAPWLLHYIGHMGLWEPMGVEVGPMNLEEVRRVSQYTTDPVTLMVALFGNFDRVEKLARDWKWSRAESSKARFLAQQAYGYRTNLEWLLAYEGKPHDWVVDLAYLRSDYLGAGKMMDWEVPKFPIQGRDLLELGMQPGEALGECLHDLKCLWATEGYGGTKEDLLVMAKQWG
jgi:tRNA nucleotidyltransferase (CCA-adding enzyme)